MCARGVEERNTMRTSEESEAETERPHTNKKSHYMQNLAQNGSGLASGASVLFDRYRFNPEKTIFSALYNYFLTIVYHVKVSVHVISKFTCTNYFHSLYFLLVVFFDYSWACCLLLYEDSYKSYSTNLCQIFVKDYHFLLVYHLIRP